VQISTSQKTQEASVSAALQASDASLKEALSAASAAQQALQTANASLAAQANDNKDNDTSEFLHAELDRAMAEAEESRSKLVEAESRLKDTYKLHNEELEKVTEARLTAEAELRKQLKEATASAHAEIEKTQAELKKAQEDTQDTHKMMEEVIEPLKAQLERASAEMQAVKADQESKLQDLHHAHNNTLKDAEMRYEEQIRQLQEANMKLQTELASRQ